MARTVRARLDDRSEDDLAPLRNEGRTDSEAIRLALHDLDPAPAPAFGL